MTKHEPQKIIWSIDAFDEVPAMQKRAAHTLRNLFGHHRFKIEPVYILSPDQLNLPAPMLMPSLERYRSAAEKTLSVIVKNINLPNLLPPKIIIQNRSSLLSDVLTICAYAKSSKTSLIMISTHARKGLSRVFLGSFTETLLLNSKIPVLTVNPSFAGHDKFDSILFATDFSNQSRAAFEQALSIAESLKTKLTLFHALPLPVQPVLQTGVFLFTGGWVSYPDFIRDEEEKHKKIATEWVEYASKKGVLAHYVIDCNNTSVVQSVLNYTKKHKIGLIALAAQSGKISTTLIGSNSRQIVRSAKCPVWVLRP